jgi:hypothetical protein
VEKAVAFCAETTFVPAEACADRVGPELVDECARRCVRRRAEIVESSEAEAQLLAQQAAGRTRTPLSVESESQFEPEPRASVATYRAALAACIAGVVEASRPGACVIPEPVANDQLQDCNARCAAEASDEIRRRVAPRAPLSPMRWASGI